jgi:hypothetical protein
MAKSDFEHVSKSKDVPFKDVHPTRTAGGSLPGKDLPAWGGTDGKESKFIRCKQCGFILDREKTPKGSGWGNIHEEMRIQTVDYDDGEVEYQSPDVSYDGIWYRDIANYAGCPLCGSSEYE